MGGEPRPNTRSNALRSAARVVLRRGVQALVLALVVGTLCFFMMRMLPGDMAFRIAAGRYGYDMVSAAAAEAVRAELGLEQPMWRALAAWWGDLLRLDLGVSMVGGQPVLDEIAHTLGHTLVLALAALGLSMPIAVVLGVLAALRPGGWFDRIGYAAAVVLRAMPPFLVAVLLMLGVAVHLGALPVAGHGEAASVWLPALTLALGLAAGASRVVRSAMRAVVTSSAFEFARTKGLSDARAVLRHGLRNAAVPVVSYLGVQTVFLIEGAVVVETLFAWPGIGHALIHAIFGRDVPVIQGTALVMGLLFVVLNALIDVACLALDPKRAAA